MKSPSKKLTPPTISTPQEDPDPVGLFPELSAKLKEAYHLGLRAFLRQNLLVRLKPAVRRRILDAATAQGGPVSFDLRITVHPRDASGFPRVVGELLSDEHSPDQQPGAPGDGPYVVTLFGERVPVSQLKTKRRRFGRRR
jgi:hypothetical protein